jgi:hypothetical protein
MRTGRKKVWVPRKPKTNWLSIELLIVFLIFQLLLAALAFAQEPDNSAPAANEAVETVVEETTTIGLFNYFDPKVTEVNLNRTIKLVIHLEWSGPPDTFRVEEISKPNLVNLEIVGTAAGSSATKTEGNKVITAQDYTYELKPVDLGMAYVKPIELKYSKKGTEDPISQETPGLEIKVIEPLPDNAPFIKWILTLIAIVIGTVIIIAFIIYFIKKGKTEPAPPPPPSADEQALADMEKARTIFEKGQARTEYVSRISVIFRKYLAAAYPEATPDLDTLTLLNRLYENERSDLEVNALRSILEVTDQVKFAKYEPEPDEVRSLVSQIEKFIDKTTYQIDSDE